MAESTLKSIREVPPLTSPHFPAEFQAVLFRLWGMVDTQKLAKILKTTPENIRREMARLSLDPDKEVKKEWRERGYITIIRNTWHLLSMSQQCELLDITQEEFDIILREDDFLWVKMGHFKPAFEGTFYRELTDEEIKRTEEIAHFVKEINEKTKSFPDNAFQFVSDYYKECPVSLKEYPSFKDADLRFIYSYFALYGDPLIDESLDPFPDRLLQEYANYGVNGVWMQGVLYQLVDYPFAPELSRGYEIRQKNLKKLVDRAAKYGIGVYLYFNEPRSMPDYVFEKFPEIKGHVRSSAEGAAALCTSTPEVQKYLENATYELFKKVEGLAGFFTITRSENLTNCYSHSNEDDCNCERCKKRSVPEVIAEVNNLLSRGARRANPDSRAIAWVWGWPDDKVEDVVKRLDKNITFQSGSETHLKIYKGGVEVDVVDYTISSPGPSDWAKNNWEKAKKHNIECCAKVQFNNTWEVSGVPYIPAFELVKEHAKNLKDEGVKHLMLSWTLGGAPSPSLRLASGIFDGEFEEGREVEGMIEKVFPENEREIIYKTQKIMSDAFYEFPFSCQTVYTAPVTAGPRAPFYLDKTGYSASMVGMPYDDVTSWRANYPVDIFENQMAKVVYPFKEAVKMLDEFKENNETGSLFEEFRNSAQGALEHFETTLNLVRFYTARDVILDGGSQAFGKNAYDVMEKALLDEEENTLSAIKTQSCDSRIGFEASNHYNYTRQDLIEKLLNIEYVKKRMEKFKK